MKGLNGKEKELTEGEEKMKMNYLRITETKRWDEGVMKLINGKGRYWSKMGKDEKINRCRILKERVRGIAIQKT